MEAPICRGDINEGPAVCTTSGSDSIVDLIARDPADQVATTIIHDCTVRWGTSC